MERSQRVIHAEQVAFLEQNKINSENKISSYLQNEAFYIYRNFGAINTNFLKCEIVRKFQKLDDIFIIKMSSALTLS